MLKTNESVLVFECVLALNLWCNQVLLSTNLPRLYNFVALFNRERTLTVNQLKARYQQRLQLCFRRIDQLVSMI
jgi:hypothetical protein